MNEFWIATAVFVALGLTPVVIATFANIRERRSTSAEGRAR